MCRSQAQGGKRCSGSAHSSSADDERYLRRMAQVEAAPDVTELLSGEKLDRDAVLTDDAAQRMIAERLSDEPQWS
jgi:hypothetical protein